jgi:CBS domain-containing protein
MKTAGWLLRQRPHNIWSVAPDMPAQDALRMMNNVSVGALVVMSRGRLVGIISERDFVRHFDQAEFDIRTALVEEIMTKRVIYVPPDHVLEECMAIMIENRLRHLPVLDGDVLVGVISIRDLVREMIADKQFMIEQLTNYVTGGHRMVS